jgi:hypothetical protein
MARRIKGRAVLWRSLTMNLMGVALDTDARYSVPYVTELITRKLGRWMKPANPAQQMILDKDLRKLAESSIKVDWYVNTAPLNF